MIELSPAVQAFIKVFSLGYLLTLLGLSISTGLWRLLRSRIAPGLRADTGFAIIVGTWMLNLGLAAYIWWGVTHGTILMTTRYFCSLMSGGWGNGITATGLTVLGISFTILAWGWRRGTVPRSLGGDFGTLPISGLAIRPASGIATAALVGVIRPEIWVNQDYWRGLDYEQGQLALAHELKHLRRRDNLKKLVLQALAGLHAVLPWARQWDANYELDSELAVDDACRLELSEQRYCELVADALSFALASAKDGAGSLSQRALPQHSALSQSSMAERLAVLARPRIRGSLLAASATVVGLSLLGSAHIIGMLSHPLPRCFFACYLGY